MKTNHLIILFGAAIILSWYFFWQPAVERGNIRNVLNTDHAINVAASQQASLSDVAWDQSKMVGGIVLCMRQINLSGCPDDFREAYLRHIDAWAEYQNVAESYGGWTGFIKGFVTAGASIIPAYQEGSSAQQKIRATWNDVLASAQRHGVAPQ
jgi:hypothetical protein